MGITLLFWILTLQAPAQSQLNGVTLLIYRSEGFNVKAPVILDGKYLAQLKRGRFITLQITPGKHRLRPLLKAKPHEDFIFEAESGKTLYISLNWPHFRHPNFSLADPHTGKLEVQALKQIEKKDMIEPPKQIYDPSK